MSKSDSWEAYLLKLLFNNTAVPNVGDATGLPGAATVGSLYVSLHTADPGEAGTQATSEATYTGYARVAVARTAGAWAITGTSPTSVSPTAAIAFPACTAGTSTVTFFGIGTSVSGATTLLYSGALSPTIAVSTGVTPQLGTATAVTED